MELKSLHFSTLIYFVLFTELLLYWIYVYASDQSLLYVGFQVCAFLMLQKRPSSSGLDSITHHNLNRINPLEFTKVFFFPPLEKAACEMY